MGPRKRIAVLGATELEASALGVVLEVRGYCVEICMSENAAMRIETPAAFLVLGLNQAERQRVESRLRLQHPEAGYAMESHGLADSQAWMNCVLERLKMATKRRPGPRPTADAAEGVRRGGPEPIYATAKRSAAWERKRMEKNRKCIA